VQDSKVSRLSRPERAVCDRADPSVLETDRGGAEISAVWAVQEMS